MKTFHRHASAALALLVSGAFAAPGAIAQTDPTPPAPPVAGPAAPMPPDARPPRGAPGENPRRMAPPRVETVTQTTLSGRVARLLPNPNGEVDGLLLDDGTQVAIPPHLSSQVLAAVKPRDTVAVTGWRAPNAQVIRATELRNTASGKKVVDDGPDGAPPTPREPAALASMNANGRIATLLHTDRGDVNGVVLDNGTSVRFPPHVGTQFTGLLRTGGTLYAQGYGTNNAQGSAIEATRLGASRDAEQPVFAAPGGPAGERPPVPPVPPVPPAPVDNAR